MASVPSPSSPADADARASRRKPATLLLTEWFPPAVGGSGELLWNIYARLGRGDVRVIAGQHDGFAVALDLRDRLSILRRSFGSGLGILGIARLANRLGLAWRVRRLTGPDVVVHCGRALPEGLVAHLAGRRFVCWTHGEELPVMSSSRELRWLMRRVHRAAAAVIANSHHTADLLRNAGVPATKIHIIHPGVDGERFRPDVRGGDVIRARFSSNGQPILLSVGRLQARKGHDLTLRALGQLADEGVTFHYVVVGEGPERARLEQLVSQFGLDRRVSFCGSVAANELPAYYAAADLFVHPNRIVGADFEGFGIVFLEAAAAALPSIGGRSGGVAEAVEEGVSGFLVDGTDVQELRSAIARLLGSSSLRTQLGRQARQRALAHFSWERAAGQLTAIDESVRLGRHVRN